MLPSRHFIVSLSLAAILGFLMRSFSVGALFFTGGFLIDIDHLIEYVMHFGWRNLNFRQFYAICVNTGKDREGEKFTKLYLILHSAEAAILFWVLTIITKNKYVFALSAGYTSHLIMDAVGNELRLSSYFTLLRARKNFDADKLFHKKKENGRS